MFHILFVSRHSNLAIKIFSCTPRLLNMVGIKTKDV